MEECLKLDNEWQFVKTLGNGSFGVVSLWENKKLEENIAIKMCKIKLLSNLTPRQKERWELEVSILQNLSHKNIVSFRSLPSQFVDSLQKYNRTGLPIMSMEYCEKGNLRSQLCKIENNCGLIELEVREILEDISDALKYLHSKKITHRDVKPDNIVLQVYDHRKSAIIYKLIDLGYAKEVMGTSSLVGTLQYVAPEMFNAKYNYLVDYWSFGITTFEIVCGLRPFEVPNLNPFQCFQMLKGKNSDEIYMFQNDKNEICFSKEFLKENFLTQCFKQNLERWLRSMLEFSPLKRGNIYPNKDVFTAMSEILNKKIITVFSMYTYEFYSYEIDDSTLLSTVQDWISRDIKLPKHEQFLIASNQSDFVDEEFAIKFYNKDEELMLYVFKKDLSTKKEIIHKLPKYVQQIFSDSYFTFEFSELKKLYCQSLFYTSTEMKLMNSYKNGITLLFKNLFANYFDLKCALSVAKRLVEKLLYLVDFAKDYEKSLQENGVFMKKRFESNLKQYKDLLLKTKECYELLKLYNLKNNKILNKLSKIQDLYSKISMFLENCDVFQFYEEILSAIKLMEEKESKVNPQIVRALSAVLKTRDKFLRFLLFNVFLSSALGTITKINKLKTVLKCFIPNVNIISEDIERNKIVRIMIAQESNKNKLFLMDTNKIIQENKGWRYRFEDFFNVNKL